MISSTFFINDVEADAIDLAKHRRKLRKEINPLHLSEIAFRKNFRISKKLFIQIRDKIAPHIGPHHPRGLSVSEKLAATLKFLAQGSYQLGVGNDFTVPMAQSTFSETLNETLRTLEQHLKPYITLEMSVREKEEARRFFYDKSGIPGITMAVDGTHIRIVAPKENPVMYFNRKGFYSLNALMICDNNSIIRYVNARYGGSNHDAFILNSSPAMDYFDAQWRNGERLSKLLG
ncbi:putative nuclease HARBI1 [Anopheles ziemanni]|uniref:putative nuclease HARBI1 n=1 Tax=Anopheles coustani TaxID=139045 RepID=UPI00265A084C|nr:putative nuclease HARBI1 [Anopheles coustani]XP_058176389.1 putative nuclease HARBI1 [Anopheles ziemanni]